VFQNFGRVKGKPRASACGGDFFNKSFKAGLKKVSFKKILKSVFKSGFKIKAGLKARVFLIRIG